MAQGKNLCGKLDMNSRLFLSLFCAYERVRHKLHDIHGVEIELYGATRALRERTLIFP